MKRWIQLCVLSFAILGFWWILTPPDQKVVPVTKITNQKIERVPAQAKVVVPAKVKPQPLQQKKLQTGPIELSDYDSQVDDARAEIVNGNRRWKFISGLSAVALSTPGIPTPLDVMSGFAVINSADVPEGVESFSLVKRDDNGLIGIFTGTIKAIGEKADFPGSFLSECPQGGIKESYPALKSYLLKANSSEEQAYFECLSSLRRFRRLEWEILDHPHGHR